MQSSTSSLLPTGDYDIEIQEIDFYSGFKTSTLVNLKVREIIANFTVDLNQTISDE